MINKNQKNIENQKMMIYKILQLVVVMMIKTKIVYKMKKSSKIYLRNLISSRE